LRPRGGTIDEDDGHHHEKAARTAARYAGNRVFRPRVRRRRNSGLPGRRAFDGDLLPGHGRAGNRGLDAGDGAIRGRDRSVRHRRRQSRQTFDRRRRRQNQPDRRSARRFRRHSGRQDERPRARAHGRHAGQAGKHSGFPNVAVQRGVYRSSEPSQTCADGTNRRSGAGGQKAVRAARRDGDGRFDPADRQFRHEQENRFRRGPHRARCQNRQRRVHEVARRSTQAGARDGGHRQPARPENRRGHHRHEPAARPRSRQRQ